MRTETATRNVYVIAASFFFIFFGFSTAQQYLVILFSADGRSSVALASLFLLYGTFLISGVIISKIISFLGGPKYALLYGASTYVLFVASIAYSNTPLLLIASCILGLGGNLLWVSSGQIIADSSRTDALARNLSYQLTGQFSGSIAGIWVGSYLARVYATSTMFWILCGVTAIGCLLILALRSLGNKLEVSDFKPYYLLKPHMLLLFPLVLGTYFSLGQTFTGINLIVVQVLGISFIPVIISMCSFSNLIGSLSSGRLAERYDKAWLLVLFAILTLLSIIIFVFGHTVPLLLFAAMLLGFSTIAVYPTALSWLRNVVPTGEYVYALSSFQMYSSIGIVSAVSANLWLPPGMSFVPGVVALTLALPGILLFRRIYSRHGTNAN